MIGKIGAWSAKHKWMVLIGWIVILLASGFSAKKLEKPMNSTFNINGLQSISTLNTIDKTFGNSSNGGNIVFAAPKNQKLSDEDKANIAKLSSDLTAIKGVKSVVNPLNIADSANRQIAAAEEKAETQAKLEVAQKTQRLPAVEIAALQEKAVNQAKTEVDEKTANSLQEANFAASQMLSKNDRIGYLSVKFDGTATTNEQNQISKIVKNYHSSNLQIELSSGLVVNNSSSSNPLLGLIIAFVILVVTFGALWAAGFPLISSIIALGISMMIINLATHFTTVNSIAPVLAMLIGLAVGIDYSLFIVNRHRQFLMAGNDVQTAIGKASKTAGTSVVFAAFTVIIALVGLAVAHVQFLTQMGISAAVAVFIAMLVAITLTPALLAFRGIKILNKKTRKALQIGKLKVQGKRASAWANFVANHAILTIIISVLLMVILAIPVAKIHLGLPNDGTNPSNLTQRKAYDLMADGFGAGINGPIVILANYQNAPTSAEITALTNKIKSVSDVSEVMNSGVKGNSALISIIPKSGPSDVKTQTLVSNLRTKKYKLSNLTKVDVSGQTAVNIDIAQHLANALPLYLLLVVGFAFLLLMIVFRSLLVPLKAVISFLLSLGVALGSTVAVYQWGWLGNLFGVNPAAPILCFLPIIVIGVLFGLSMDYEIFLMSGIREHYVAGEEAKSAVKSGFALSAKVVVSAALIMIGVFGNGIFTSGSTTKPIAFALAIGVLVDAFIIRLTLLPAILTVLGKTTWKLPKVLDKILPHIDIE